MIVTAGIFDLVEIIPNPCTNLRHLAEIHRCSGHRCDLSGRNRFAINNRCIVRCQNLQLLLLCAAGFLSVQVEICMVCEVSYCLFIGRCTVCNAKLSGIIQCISHGHIHISRKSLIAVRTVIVQYNMRIIRLCCCPERRMKTVLSAVQVILIVICLKHILRAVDRQLCIRNTVAVSSDHCAEITVDIFILLHRIIAKQHIADIAVLIGHTDRL